MQDVKQQEEEPVGSRRKMEPSEVTMLAEYLGLGVITLELHLTDYSRGTMRIGVNTRCFWLKDGRQVKVTVHQDSVIASVGHEPDPDIPEPLEE